MTREVSYSSTRGYASTDRQYKHSKGMNDDWKGVLRSIQEESLITYSLIPRRERLRDRGLLCRKSIRYIEDMIGIRMSWI